MKKKAKPIIIYTVMSILLLAGAMIPEKLVVVTSKSIKHRIFYKEPVNQETQIGQGDYVLITLPPGKVTGDKPVRVTKLVGCDENQHLKQDNKFFYCGSKYLGIAKSKTKKGINLKPFKFNGLIPSGKFFALGQNKDSYDSRYIGLMEKSNVQAKLIPII